LHALLQSKTGEQREGSLQASEWNADDLLRIKPGSGVVVDHNSKRTASFVECFQVDRNPAARYVVRLFSRIKEVECTMMISKFHKLIQSKVFWIIFVGLICISMIGFGSYARTTNTTNRNKAAVGRLYGKNVQYPEFRQAYSEVYLSFMLSAGTYINVTEELNELLEENAWKRLAMLKKAEQAGMTASDAEVLLTLRSHPFFMKNGAFDPGMYSHFTEQVLPRMGMPPAALEDLFRNETIIRKMLFLPAQAALITPDEVNDAFHLYSDRFVLSYAELTPEAVSSEVKPVSDEAAEQYYRAHPQRFRLPEKVRVKYVAFPVSDFIDAVDVTAEAAQDYYNANLPQYAQEPAETNTTETVAYIPFEEVQAEIIQVLKKEAARQKAMDQATEMVIDLAPNRNGQAPAFEAAAEEYQREVRQVPPFARRENVVGITDCPDFSEAAFRLEETPEDYFSDAVPGDDQVYIIALVKRMPAFIPEFEAVREQAREQARQQAVQQALSAQADALYAALKKEGFAAGAESAGLTVKTTEAFGLYDGLPDNPYGNLLISATARARKGELLEPLPAGANRLLVFVKDRIPGDETETLPALRNDLVAGIRQQRMNELMNTWQNQVLREADFEDLRQTDDEE
jgi:hypothetical protein